MRTRHVRWALAAVIGVCVLYALLPGCGRSVGRQMSGVSEFMPYTEVSIEEREAEQAALDVLRADSWAVQYADALPTIDGHELVMWNDRIAGLVYVDADGSVELLEAGRPQEMLLRSCIAFADTGDEDAYVAARGAFRSLVGNLGVHPLKGGLLCGHYVRFAHGDGTHVVVRVGVDGEASITYR